MYEIYFWETYCDKFTTKETHEKKLTYAMGCVWLFQNDDFQVVQQPRKSSRGTKSSHYNDRN